MSWYFSVICLGGEETKQFHDFENALVSFVNSRCFRTNLKKGVESFGCSKEPSEKALTGLKMLLPLGVMLGSALKA